MLIAASALLAGACGGSESEPEGPIIGGSESGDAGVDDDGADDAGDGADDGDSGDTPAPDPGDEPDDSGSPDDPPPPDDPSDDPPASGPCQPTPTRMIVLGDSIAACQGVGGKDSMDCAPKRFHSIYNESYAPTTYENAAVSGAKTRDVVNQQMPGLQTGMPGHAFVVIYVGGNDLSPFLLSTDQGAVDGYNALSTELAGLWEGIFAFFADTTKFPDGVTLLVNSQYDPFDGCTALPYNISQTKLGLLVQYNEEMAARTSAHEWVFLADQHAPFLGHGHHAGQGNCPYYAEGSAGWMNDLIHPNAAGHANLADVMAGETSTMYGGCTE